MQNHSRMPIYWPKVTNDIVDNIFALLLPSALIPLMPQSKEPNPDSADVPAFSSLFSKCLLHALLSRFVFGSGIGTYAEHSCRRLRISFYHSSRQEMNHPSGGFSFGLAAAFDTLSHVTDTHESYKLEPCWF